MRFYSFTNFYLSSIQQGIQPGHACVELFLKYKGDSKQHDILYDWAENHKTFMCMNGGNNASLEDLHSFVEDVNNPYPYAVFYEDEQSLNGVMTSIGMVLPEKIYLTALAERNAFRSSVFQRFEEHFVEEYFTRIATFVDEEGNGREFLFTDWEYDLVLRLNTYKLAQ